MSPTAASAATVFVSCLIAGKGQVGRDELAAMLSYHIKSRDLSAILRTLAAKGQVRVTLEPTFGRPRQVITWTGPALPPPPRQLPLLEDVC